MTLQKLKATGEVEWLMSEDLNDIADPNETPAVRSARPSAAPSTRPEFTLEVQEDITGKKATIIGGFMLVKGILSIFVDEPTRMVRVTCLQTYHKESIMAECQEILLGRGLNCTVHLKDQETSTGELSDGTFKIQTPKEKPTWSPTLSPVTPCTPVKNEESVKSPRASKSPPQEELRKGMAETTRIKGRESIGGVNWNVRSDGASSATPTYLDTSKFDIGGYGAMRQHASELTMEAIAARKAEFARDQQRTRGVFSRIVTAPINAARWLGGWVA